MIEIITIKLSDDDRRALARAATKAAIRAGFTYAGWCSYRNASADRLHLEFTALYSFTADLGRPADELPSRPGFRQIAK